MTAFTGQICIKTPTGTALFRLTHRPVWHGRAFHALRSLCAPGHDQCQSG